MSLLELFLSSLLTTISLKTPWCVRMYITCVWRQCWPLYHCGLSSVSPTLPLADLRACLPSLQFCLPSFHWACGSQAELPHSHWCLKVLFASGGRNHCDERWNGSDCELGPGQTLGWGLRVKTGWSWGSHQDCKAWDNPYAAPHPHCGP